MLRHKRINPIFGADQEVQSGSHDPFCRGVVKHIFDHQIVRLGLNGRIFAVLQEYDWNIGRSVRRF